MSSQIISQRSVPKLICQKDICQKQTLKNREIFSCNLQKNLDDNSMMNCKGCIGKQKDRSVNYCQINFEDLCLQLSAYRETEKEILVQVGEVEKKFQQALQNAMEQINKAQENLRQIVDTIRSQCLFKQNSKLEECFNQNEKASQDQVIQMLRELREKIAIIEDRPQNNQKQQLDKNKLNVIYENGTISIDDFLKHKLSQIQQMLCCFEQQITQINKNDYNIIQEQVMNTNYQQIKIIENLNQRKIYNLKFNRSNNLFAFGSSNLNKEKAYCVEVWKIENNNVQQVQILQQYPDVTALCFNKKDDSLFTGSLDSQLICWQQLSNGQYSGKQQKIEIKGQINCIEVDQSSTILTVGSKELSIFKNNNNQLMLIKKYDKVVKSLTFSNCNQIIIAQCIIANEDKIQLYQIKWTNENFEIIPLGEVIQEQQNQQIKNTRFILKHLYNQVSLFMLSKNRCEKILNSDIQKLNCIEKCGIGFCVINNSSNLLAISSNVNNQEVTQIVKINEQNQVILLETLQMMGYGLFFSNNGKILVIWDGNSLVVLKDKFQTF